MRTGAFVEARLAEPELELRIRGLGRRLARRSRCRFWSPARIADERAMALIRDGALHAPLLRLVDVAPACRTATELGAHLEALLGEVETDRISGRVLQRMTAMPALHSVTGRLALRNVRRMARTFIVGETASEGVSRLRRLWRRGAATSVDLLGEKTTTQVEARPMPSAARRHL
jgi:hypothetical protein